MVLSPNRFAVIDRRRSANRGQAMNRFLLFLSGVLLGAVGVWFAMVMRSPQTVPVKTSEPAPPVVVAAAPWTPAAPTSVGIPASLTPAAAASMVTPAQPSSSTPAAASTMAPAGSTSVATATPAIPPPPLTGLLIPVEGVKAGTLIDTFNDARSQGRVHDAIDIMSARGTPVLAADDGKVEKLFTSKQGGLTIYEFDPTTAYAYYYAHLDRYADGLVEGKTVHRGEVIGYVGSTGNASPDAPHLHFAIFVLGPEKRWWQGTAINPYPLLGGRAR
jgi:murein DD-endopeptidase MepM/ murein hydrolase activator NlpD